MGSGRPEMLLRRRSYIASFSARTLASTSSGAASVMRSWGVLARSFGSLGRTRGSLAGIGPDGRLLIATGGRWLLDTGGRWPVETGGRWLLDGDAMSPADDAAAGLPAEAFPVASFSPATGPMIAASGNAVALAVARSGPCSGQFGAEPEGAGPAFLGK